MYKKAEATAKSAGDSARARRLILNRFLFNFLVLIDIFCVYQI